MSIKERISKAIFQCPYNDEIKQDIAGLKTEVRVLAAKCHKMLTAIEVFMAANPTEDKQGTLFRQDLKPLVLEEKKRGRPEKTIKKGKKNVGVQNTPRSKSTAQ